MKRLSISLVALGCLLNGGCDPATIGADTVDTAAFLRVEAGHLWNFGYDIGETWPEADSLQLFLRSGDADGEDDEAPGVPFGFSAGVEDQEPEDVLGARFEVDADGAVLLTEVFDFEGAVSIFDPPPVFGPSSWEVGDTGSSDTQLDGSSITFQVTLADRGEHEVYYGMFPDVAHLVVDDGGATALGGDWWLAADVGPVRLQTVDYTLPEAELVTYR